MNYGREILEAGKTHLWYVFHKVSLSCPRVLIPWVLLPKLVNATTVPAFDLRYNVNRVAQIRRCQPASGMRYHEKDVSITDRVLQRPAVPR